MKTQIITLESHDDLISVRDKLSWAKTPRILLVWPKYEQVTLRVLDLKVLQRHADSLGAQLGLVTRRLNVRRDAESLGIPVFDSSAAAQKEVWQVAPPRSQRIPKAPRRNLRALGNSIREKEAPWRTSLLGRVLTFTVGVLAFVTVASLFVPRAAVTLYPEMQIQSALIPVAAGESFESVSITGDVPARPLSVVVSAEQSLAVASEIEVPRSKAQGIARFTNLGQAEVSIAAGTILSTASDSPVNFVTLNDTLLPSGVDEFVDVPIEALQPGSRGNVAADTIIIVEGQLGLSISVTNPNLTRGGTNSTLTGATDADRADLREVVMDNLRRDAEEKLRSQISTDDVLLMDTFEVTEIIEETFSPPAGQAGKSLVLKMQVEFSARYVSAEDLKQLSTVTLDSSITAGFVPSGAVSFEQLTSPSTDNSGITHFELDVSRTLLRDINELQVFPLLRGYSPNDPGDELMQTLSLRQKPEIVISPSWWPWMPLIPFNISIETK